MKWHVGKSALGHLLARNVMKEEGMEFIHILMKAEEKERQREMKKVNHNQIFLLYLLNAS